MEKTGNKKEGAAERKLLCPRRFMESRGSNRTFLWSDCRFCWKDCWAGGHLLLPKESRLMGLYTAASRYRQRYMFKLQGSAGEQRTGSKQCQRYSRWHVNGHHSTLSFLWIPAQALVQSFPIVSSSSCTPGWSRIKETWNALYFLHPCDLPRMKSSVQCSVCVLQGPPDRSWSWLQKRLQEIQIFKIRQYFSISLRHQVKHSHNAMMLIFLCRCWHHGQWGYRTSNS